MSEVPWDQAPLGVYGMARWRTGTEWPACRVKVDLPFFYAIVPARDVIQRPSIAEDEIPRTWRPFLDARERARWEAVTTRKFTDISKELSQCRTPR